MLGWTVIVAIFVHRIGIESLPFLFVGNAILMMCGTMIFSELIRFIRKEILIITTLVLAAVLIFAATTFILPISEIGFLITSVIGISLFLGQVNILIQLFVEDMFTPIESESAFPLIETAETIGGIFAGLLLATAGSFIAPYKFLYILIIISLAIIPTLSAFSKTAHNDLPNLNLKKQGRLRDISKLQRIEEGWAEIKKTSFLQAIVVVILCQFVIFNLVEFQYTKAVQQKVYNAHESTIVQETRAPEIIRLGDHSIELASLGLQPDTYTVRTLTTNKPSEATLEKQLAHTLGLFQMIISLFALATQLFVASKVVKSLGVVQSLLVHPILMLANFTLMTLKFNISTAMVAKTGFEMTRSIFQTSYLSSYYSLKEEVREEIKEFMEGIITPIGAVIGTILIFLFQYLLSEANITLGINIAMISMAVVMAYVIYNLQKEYTAVSSEALHLVDNTADKLNSIEILSQNGHTGNIHILIKALDSPLEKNIVKIKILEALGRLKKKRAIPTIIKYLENPSKDVQLAAVNALLQYDNIDKHFFRNAFARFSMAKSLKRLFEKSSPIETKEAIIKIMARINRHDVVEYLVELLETAPTELKRDCIGVIGHFHDLSSIKFIEPFLDSKNVGLQCAAMESLWQYGKYREEYRNRIIEDLKTLLRSKKQGENIYALKTIGTIGLHQFEEYVKKLSSSKKIAVKEAALKTLIQLQDHNAIKPFVELLLSSKHSYKRIKKYMHGDNVSAKFKKAVEFEINKQVSREIHEIFLKNNEKVLEEFTVEALKTLKHLYSLIEKDREVLKVSEIIEASVRKHVYRYENQASATT
ncbi:hypothetical protein HOG48_00905 [Candidatus Peregrinibacteria bacterium]|nr:hypothetical protein [Candidatus Peregrinibacteria bacterium]